MKKVAAYFNVSEQTLKTKRNEWENVKNPKNLDIDKDIEKEKEKEKDVDNHNPLSLDRVWEEIKRREAAGK